MQIDVGFANYWVISCTNDVPIKSGDFRRVSFYMTPTNVPISKTSLITGLANYEYIKTGSTSIKIATVPWH